MEDQEVDPVNRETTSPMPSPSAAALRVPDLLVSFAPMLRQEGCCDPHLPHFMSPQSILTSLETATKGIRKPAAAPQPKRLRTSIIVDSDADSSDFPPTSMIGEYSGKKVNIRDSLSSVSASNSYNESSGYSTPATSAFTTPAPSKSAATTTTSSRRGRRRTTAMEEESITPAVNAVARAAALRNSQYSLTANNKRKREEDEEDVDPDNTADAQLARALQEQEDAAVDQMDTDIKYTPRRTPRKAQKILPKSDYLSDFSEDDSDVGFAITSSKKAKVVLGSKGSNAVSFSSRRKSIVVDSDSDDFVEIDDSEDDEPVALTTPRSRMKQVLQEQSKSYQATKPRRGKMAPPPRRSTKYKSAFSATSFTKPASLQRQDTKASSSSALTSLATDAETESEFDSDMQSMPSDFDSADDSLDDGDGPAVVPAAATRGPRSRRAARQDLNLLEAKQNSRAKKERARLELHHPELHTMWNDLENLPKIGQVKIEQPKSINRELKPFQLEGVAWMKAMEDTDWGGGLLGDEMGMGKTIQAVSLIMSDWPAKQPSLVLIPPVALMQWQQEIAAYTDGTLKTFVFHGTNAQTKGVTVKELMKYNVILMSYNSLESMFRKQEKGFKRKNGLHKEKSVIHQIHFHRVILDEAHNIKVSLILRSSHHN